MKYGDVVKMRADAEDYDPKWAQTRVMVVAVFENDLIDGVIVMNSRGMATGDPLLIIEYEWEPA